jgi:hypothetical protein
LRSNKNIKLFFFRVQRRTLHNEIDNDGGYRWDICPKRALDFFIWRKHPNYRFKIFPPIHSIFNSSVLVYPVNIWDDNQGFEERWLVNKV